ncbi:NAD(P)H-binding protein [Streptomyces sp. NPDC059009]|uniref:NAD(P)H-binding protein n=1 Tax=Streptomyces sp. NPDC059009 TaxID=3346694 RepID=UPI0036909DF9
MILLTGATGTVGRLVLERLAHRFPVRILVRDPAAVAALAASTAVQLAVGNFEDPTSLATAMTGVHAALIITAAPTCPDHDIRLVEAARSAGVQHLVKLSALAVTEPRANDLITRWQRVNEELIRGSGMTWTLLRPRSFMSNTLGWARSIQEEGVVRDLYGTAGNATIDPRDIADVAVQSLTDPRHIGQAYALTGPEVVSAVEQTRILSEILDRPLNFEELTPEQARHAHVSRYLLPIAEALIESADRRRRGEKAHTDDTVARLLNRPARTYRDWARDHVGAFDGRGLGGGMPAQTADRAGGR